MSLCTTRSDEFAVFMGSNIEDPGVLLSLSELISSLYLVMYFLKNTIRYRKIAQLLCGILSAKLNTHLGSYQQINCI